MKTCKIDGCTSPVKGRGLCNKHYFRALRSGELSQHQNKAEQVQSFIEQCLSSQTDGCIVPEFRPITNDNPYPSYGKDGKDRPIGWTILEKTKGNRPSPSHVMRHLCGNAGCCNPRHLCWGTELENAADRKIHGTEYDKNGSKNPRAYLTDEQVREIRSKFRRYSIRPTPDALRSNKRELAVEYDVPEGVIQGIVNKHTYRDVT